MKTRGFLLVTIVLVAVLGLAVLGGCSKEQPAKTQISVVNTKCPIMGNAIDPGRQQALLSKAVNDPENGQKHILGEILII